MHNIKSIYIYFTCLIILFISSCTPPGYVKKQIFFDEDKRNEIVETAGQLVGVKYKQGGKSPEGFDCSGFTMYVYKKNGCIIPRKASSQFYSGKRISLKSAKPGDLIFFNINNTKISHVGIYTGNKNFIHAPSSGKNVCYASLETSYWEDRYAGTITYFINSKKDSN